MKVGDIVTKDSLRGLIVEMNAAGDLAFIWWLNVPRYNYEGVSTNQLEVISAH